MQLPKIIDLTALTIFIFITSVFGIPIADKDVKIKQYHSSNNVEEKYYLFSYTLSDGQQRVENINFKDLNGVKTPEVFGSYKFIGSDNIPYEVTYTADENGFHATGDHLPGSKNFDPYVKIAIENVTCTFEFKDVKETFPASFGQKGEPMDISTLNPERMMQLFPSFSYQFYADHTGFKLTYIVDEGKCVIYAIDAWKPVSAHVIGSLVG